MAGREAARIMVEIVVLKIYGIKKRTTDYVG